MSLRFLSVFFILLSTCFFSSLVVAEPLSQRPDVQAFIQDMVNHYQFDKQSLDELFNAVQLHTKVTALKSVPYSATPWYQYRKHFINTSHIDAGVKFWRQYYKVLSKVEKTYGVPANIIVAIIGMETSYGRSVLKYRAIDSLATLAFNYPPRAPYFLKELREFLLLTREQGLDPLSVKSSYDGGLGLAQFMPSSYRYYGVKIESDKQVDLFNSMPDCMASIANYLKQNGWQTGGLIAISAVVDGAKTWPYKRQKAQHSLQELIQQGIRPSLPLNTTERANMLTLEGKNSADHWLIFDNFYAITRYNTSPMYAMAVYELSQQLAAHIQKETLHDSA